MHVLMQRSCWLINSSVRASCNISLFSHRTRTGDKLCILLITMATTLKEPVQRHTHNQIGKYLCTCMSRTSACKRYVQTYVTCIRRAVQCRMGSSNARPSIALLTGSCSVCRLQYKEFYTANHKCYGGLRTRLAYCRQHRWSTKNSNTYCAAARKLKSLLLSM